MTLNFTHDALPGRIVFGCGRISDVPHEVDYLGARRVVLVAAAEENKLAAPLAERLGERMAGRVDHVRQHVPADVARAACERATSLSGDLLVSLGGGSTTGLAKAVALETGLPILAIPTTYAGSEMTPIWGVTANATKRTGRDLRVLPRTVVYDPELTVTLPVALSVASGLNALAHCAEALWVPAASPVTSALAEDGIRALASSLPRVQDSPGNLDARGDALYGAHVGGIVLGAVGTGLHHKLAHVLGGAFELPHAELHSALLTHTVAFHVARHSHAAARIKRALGVDDATRGIADFVEQLGAPTHLEALGMSEVQAKQAATLAVEARIGEPKELQALLRTAWRAKAYVDDGLVKSGVRR